MPTPEALFVKISIKIFKDDGFLRAIGLERLQTLIALAMYMDKHGYCFPSESLLAKDLRVSVTQVSKRIKDLTSFRWNGQPIVYKERQERQKGKFQSNHYSIQFECGLSIFDND